MIGRLLRGSGEPRSIFEHIDAHVRPGVPGLTEGGAELPDEHELATSELRFAPGAEERILGTAVASADDLEAVERIYGALAALARKSSQANRRRLRELFQEGNVRVRIDPLRDRLSAESPPNAVELYPELRELFLRSGYRDEVKYAMALLSGFQRPEDADLFRVVGRHEEFTVYAAVALATVTGDPLGEWLGLLSHVSGWGRTELAELILREPRAEDVRAELVRHGLGYGNALGLARECRLDQLLGRADADAELLDGAREIVDSLVWDWDSPDVLTDYEDAGPAVENLLLRLGEHPRGFDEYITAFELQRMLTRDPEPAGLAACGFDDARRERVAALCEGILAGENWPERVTAALQADDDHERLVAMEVAARLELDMHDYLLARVREDPGDSHLWARFVQGADEARIREAVALALELWDLGDIARGPALDRFGGPGGPLASAGWIVQELVHHPGVGGPLLGASLQSPVIRDRVVALRALARWEQLPADLLAQVAEARANDPDDDVRGYAALVIAGEPFPER